MKNKFLKVCSFLLAISMLVIPVHAATPAEEMPIQAVGGSVMLYEGKPGTVTVAIAAKETLECYGIEGVWDQGSNGITLTKVEANAQMTFGEYDYIEAGKVQWNYEWPIEGTDESSDALVKCEKGTQLLIATYEVAAGTPAGDYKVSYTSNVFTGSDYEPIDEDIVFEATITVTHHECVDTGRDHVCDDENCENKNMGDHVDGDDADHKCDYGCGTDNMTDHVYGSEWKTDETNHWHECACGAKSDEGAHADETTKDHKCDTCGYVMSTCTDGDDADHKCDHCGKDGITNHVFGTEWKTDEANHWHECACGAKSDEGTHADVTTKDHKCDTCGYVMSTCADGDDADHKCDHCGKDGITNHVFGTEWKTDEANHWHECACGAKSDEGTHADVTTKDHKCDTCGYVMSTCADGDDADHKCDHCGTDNITEHTHSTYGSDENNHWSVCACGETIPNTSAPHDFTDGDCVCGAKKPTTGLKGDVDLDGDVDMDDLTYLAEHIAKIITITNAQSLENAEVTGDGNVTMDDLTKLAEYIAKIIPSLD